MHRKVLCEIRKHKGSAWRKCVTDGEGALVPGSMTLVLYERMKSTGNGATGTIGAPLKLSLLGASLRSLGLTTQADVEHIGRRSTNGTRISNSQSHSSKRGEQRSPDTRHTGDKKWHVR